MTEPKNNPEEFFGTYNNIRSSDVTAHFFDPKAANLGLLRGQVTVRKRFSRDSLRVFGNTFNARVIAVDMGIPSRAKYPRIYSNSLTTTPNSNTDTEVPQYFLFFLTNELDSFMPDFEFEENPGANLFSLKGKAISAVPASEFGPVGAGDIVKVYLPNKDSYDGALVREVVVRNSLEPVTPEGLQLRPGTPGAAAAAVLPTTVTSFSPGRTSAFGTVTPSAYTPSSPLSLDQQALRDLPAGMVTRPQSFGRVLLFGDSQIELGFGRGLENWLRTQDEATVTSRIGRSSWATEHLLNGGGPYAAGRAGARSLSPGDYDTIILSFGGNDLGVAPELAAAAAPLTELIRFLKSGGATIIFLPTLPFPDASRSSYLNPKRAEYRALQAPIARAAHADIVIDLAEVTGETGYVTDTSDGIHLTQQSGENVAQILWSGNFGGRSM